MTPIPAIFDRKLQRARRDRAAAQFAEHAALKQLAAGRLVERLDDITRDFPLALDLGGHDGTLARLLAGHPKIGTLITAERSESLLARAPAPKLRADEEWLPIADGSLDLILSSLSFHWVNDLPGALIQMRRALKPDGLLLVNLPGASSLHELRDALTQAESELRQGTHPRVSPFIDLRDAGALLQRAGLALPVADSETITVTYPNSFALFQDLRGMGETNALAERSRIPTTRTLFNAASAHYQARYAMADGRISATFELITLTGWAPHAGQPKPLAPGSAEHSLAKALQDQGAQQQ